MDHANPQDFSGSQDSLSVYPGPLLQPLRPAWALRERMLGQNKLLAALALLGAFRLAARGDFVLYLHLLAWRPCRPWATSLSRGFPCLQQAVGNCFLHGSQPTPITPFSPAALQRKHPGHSMPSPVFSVSSPPMGSPLFLMMPPDGAENPKALKKPPIKPPALAGTVGRVVSSLNMRHKHQDMREKAVYSSNLARKLFA